MTSTKVQVSCCQCFARNSTLMAPICVQIKKIPNVNTVPLKFYSEWPRPVWIRHKKWTGLWNRPQPDLKLFLGAKFTLLNLTMRVPHGPIPVTKTDAEGLTDYCVMAPDARRSCDLMYSYAHGWLLQLKPTFSVISSMLL